MQQLQKGIYEKNTETALALLAALSGESILLLGPPGVAKSMVARRLKAAFEDARSFEYLMSRFSTPDELFGPVSIARLKTADKYERATDGYLPTADVVFLDEIWKAGPAIQNTLLMVMNEKLFRNGEREIHLPLKLLVAASNELPAKGEGLEALWDRFLVRVECRCIKSEETFRLMLCEDIAADTNIESPINNEEYAQWQQAASRLPLSEPLLNAISEVRRQLQHVKVEGYDLPRRIYISDRRWKHIARLLRTSAFVQERTEADVEDLLPMRHCLWNEPEEQNEVQRMVINAVFKPIADQLNTVRRAVHADIEACTAQKALNKALREGDHRDDNLAIVDRYFYQIDNHGTGHTCVFITDFKRLPPHSVRTAPAQAVMYNDPYKKGRCIVRLAPTDGTSALQVKGEPITLCRDNEHIYINGVAFNLRQKGSAVLSPQTGSIGGLFAETEMPTASSSHYETEVENICNALDHLAARLRGNLFVNSDDVKMIDAYLQHFYKQIALCRVDVRKLLYGE